MAQVFLSYDREDGAKARVIAQALERANHFVWWDLHIKGGAEYGKVIEEALETADAVVVLWSSNSVNSAWVRDEAAAGRDSGRLVPVLIEAVTPPMGFRQYQSLDFAAWKGRGKPPRMAELLASIDALGGREAAQPGRATPPPASPVTRGGALPKWAVISGALLLALVAIGLIVGLALNDPRGARVTSVAVEAADSSAASQALARDLFVKLGTLQSSGAEAMQLVDSRDLGIREADVAFEVGAIPDSAAGANLLLFAGGNRALLWSKDFKLPEERRADLNEQVAFTAARVLRCALEIREAGIDQDERLAKLYLDGCSTLAEFTGVYVRPALPAFQEVTRKAPLFEEGWTKLLLAEAQVIEGGGYVEGPNGYRDLRRLVREVRKRFPDNAAAFYAEVVLMPIVATKQRLELTERAVEKHPDNAFLLQQRALLLFRVGRVAEAVAHAKRAAEADPLSAKTRADYIAVLAYAGLIERASQELEKGEKLWPGSYAMLDASSRVHTRFGDPKKALAIERSGVFDDESRLEPFILARIDPTPANVERAIAANKAMFGRDDRALGFLMQTLGEFGRDDELFEFFANMRGEAPIGTAGVLFREPLKNFRRDPRFMQVAQRFGLVDYWQSTGKWPDFCFEPGLPYDCKAEAAKLT